MTPHETRHRARKVLWNLRPLALFLIGPVIGLTATAAIFGLPPSLQLAAALMFLVWLGLFATLARSEWQRLSSSR